MAVETRSYAGQAVSRPAVFQVLRVVAPLLVLSILVQAVFAGRGLFINTDNLDIHGGIGLLTLLLAVVQAVLVPLAGLRGSGRGTLVVATVLLVVLVVVQFVLGGAGRDGGQAAAWHVPNGVLIFGIATGVAAGVNGIRLERGSR